MIKVEHSVFALPFALVSAFLAAEGVPHLSVLALIVAAMVTARSAAMAFNRFLDAEIDARNPRTASRSIPAGRLSKPFALGFTVVCIALFIAVCAALNPLALMLSPVVVLVLLGYSATKRFTSQSHFVLGAALGLAPIGAYVAVRGELAWDPIWLGLAVVGWTAGFDMIYACQDMEFDRKEGLQSIPARVGVQGALRFARVLHLFMLFGLTWLGVHWQIHPIYWLGMVLVALCLVVEHALVWNGDLSRINMAFFTMNGVVSLCYGAATITALVWSLH
ncbi:MAG: putative 4-hydroxybenzoate polyprenyltransferase [Acidobacteria bacterium]|nr:putative 4-hydroxybenzoate polyprenyltransferase [Acidobacteriota bacterium]